MADTIARTGGFRFAVLADTHVSTDHPTQARTTWLRAAEAYDRANAPAEAADSRRNADR